ncbi:hypothetical protein C436_18076 [Haloarcula marismortui ATCC 33800]|uniref:Uncharacterized protein n=1 Tax=Haloarcula marismortui ATCC 33800 TaxID=662476 RepID=M0JQL2_9EURY|nr:hypothetical protein C436_18076 [Haloarcula sinaiiensis ATCC 33800]
MAGALSEVHDSSLELSLAEGDRILIRAEQEIDTTTLRRLRKLTEVLEDDLGINLGHGKFARMASTAATASSVVAVAIAGWNLVEAADTLRDASKRAESLQAVKEDRFGTFYRAIGLFVVECFLFTTPLNYKTAWKGTRYLNNHYLYRLRSTSKLLYRLTLSEVHYAIRGFTKEALRNADQFASYLAQITIKSVKILQEYSDDGVDDLIGTVRQEVEEFHTFVENSYQLIVPEIELQSVVQEVVKELSTFIDLSELSSKQIMSGIDI